MQARGGEMHGGRVQCTLSAWLNPTVCSDTNAGLIPARGTLQPERESVSEPGGPPAAGRDYAAQKDSPVGRVSIPVSEHVSAGVPRPGCLYTAELGVPADELALPASPFGPVCLLWALVGRDTERDHGARVLGLERSTRHEEFQDGKAW